MKSSKSLRLSRRPTGIAQRHAQLLALHGGPGPGVPMDPRMRMSPAEAPDPELVDDEDHVAEPSDKLALRRLDSMTGQQGVEPGRRSGSGSPKRESPRPGSPHSIDSSAAEAPPELNRIPHAIARLPVLTEIRGGGPAIESCVVATAVGIVLAARCNSVVLAAVCVAVESNEEIKAGDAAKAANQTDAALGISPQGGPDPLDLCRSALDLVTSMDGGCACLGSVGKEAATLVLATVCSSSSGGSWGLGNNAVPNSWLMDGLPGPTAHAKNRAVQGHRLRSAASRDLGSVGRLVGFSADARDVLANPPSVRAILQSAMRRSRPASPAHEPISGSPSTAGSQKPGISSRDAAPAL